MKQRIKLIKSYKIIIFYLFILILLSVSCVDNSLLESFNSSEEKSKIHTYAWTAALGGYEDDACNAIMIDDDNNIYASGYFEGEAFYKNGSIDSKITSLGMQDGFVAIYNKEGAPCNVFNIGGEGNDNIVDIGIDSENSLFYIGLAGYLDDGDSNNVIDFNPFSAVDNIEIKNSSKPFLTSLYNTNCYSWTNTLNKSNIYSIKFDADDYIYIFYEEADYYKFAKYSNQDSWIEIWSFDIDKSSNICPLDFDVDANSNVFIAGYFNGTDVDFNPGAGTDLKSSNTGSNDIFFTKIQNNASGDDLEYCWTLIIGGNGDDRANKIRTDLNNNLYITGYFHGNNVDFDPEPNQDEERDAYGDKDTFLLKMDNDGAFAWVTTFGGSEQTCIGEVISIDLSSYIYVSGSFSGSVDFNPHITAQDIKTANNDFDQFLTKYSYNGGYVHTKTFDGTGSIQINDIKFDNNNNMILTGNFNGNIDFDTGTNIDNIESLDNKDAFITKYNYQ